MANLISRPLWDLRRDIDQLFDNLFGGSSSPQTPGTDEFRPKVDFVETDNEYKLLAELPGMRSEDVEVRLEEGMITIRGEKRREEHKSARGLEYVERSFGTFARSLQLPPGIDLGRIKAKFDHGILIITIPKGAGQHARRIPVVEEEGQAQGPAEMAPPSRPEVTSEVTGSGGGGHTAGEGPEPPEPEDREPVETG